MSDAQFFISLELLRQSLLRLQETIGLAVLPALREFVDTVMRPIRAREALKRAVVLAIVLFVMLSIGG